MDDSQDDVESLVAALGRPDKRAVRQAADKLIVLAPDRPDLVTKLEVVLTQTARDKRWPIAYVLAHVSSPSSACMEALHAALDDKDPDIRWAVSLLLVRLAKSDKSEVRRLLALLNTGTPTQRRMAVYCLRDLGLNDLASRRALGESLRDPDPLVRVAVVTTLKSRGEIGKDLLGSLLRLFIEDPDHRVRHATAVTLGEIGSPTEEIFSALREATRTNDPRLKKAAALALDLLQKKAHRSTDG